MKKIILGVLYALGGILVACVALVVLALWSEGRGHDQFVAPKKDLPTYVAGRWDWKIRKQPCTDSAHVISFAPDGSTMEIRQEWARGKGGADDPTVYDILRITPSRIRGAIRGETRKTAAGVPVVWDLVMFNQNEYHWQRTDLSGWHYSVGIVRCSPKDSGGGIAQRDSDP
jgi:hypothetical protein